jgi:PAB1-binding protein PBP1
MSRFIAQRLATDSEEEADEAPQSLNRRKSGKSGRRKTKNVRSVMSFKAIFKDSKFSLFLSF